MYAKAVEIKNSINHVCIDYLYGYAGVENIAYNKEVILLYSYKISKGPWEEWKELPAVYKCPAESASEYWYFRTDNVQLYSPRGTVEFQFALKYSVEGRTYWDNKGHLNFYLGIGENPHYPSLILANGFIVLNKAYASYTTHSEISFAGSIVVKSAGSQKHVKVVYTTDDWLAVKEAPARCGHPLYFGLDSDLWYFETTIHTNSLQLKFALVCAVQEKTFWDNNFGANYVLNIPGEVV